MHGNEFVTMWQADKKSPCANMGRKAMAMQANYLSSEIVLHSHSPPTLAAVRHNSPVIGSYFSVAPGMTCACVTVPPPDLFVFVYDAAENPKSYSVTFPEYIY
jgi:hypothetical protein